MQKHLCCPRTGDIILSGKVGTVILASSGTGRVFISGVTQAVSANLNGLGSAVIDSASGAILLSVTVTAMAVHVLQINAA